MNITIVQQALDVFGISQEIINYILLQKTIVRGKEKLIFLLRTQNGHQYVCRFYGENNNNVQIVNQQSHFAMMLRNKGIITPLKYMKDNTYCIPFAFENKSYLVTIEDYLEGSDFIIDLKLYEKLGELLGKIHHISEMIQTTICYSIISDSIMNGTATFKRILNKSMIQEGANKCINDLSRIHDSLVYKLKEDLHSLPCGSVHGDLSTFNNIIDCYGKIGIIDFDLAGKESYLSDALVTFYSSIYKCSQVNEASNGYNNRAFTMFLNGYLSKRKLTKAEINAFPYMAALFDGLYFSKHLISKANGLLNSSMLNDLSKAFQHFDVSEHQFKMREYL